MNKEEMEAQVTLLEDRLRIVEDVKEIKKLQRIYGYYLDYGMWTEVIDLFSDNAESVEIADSGVFLGKAGIERFFIGVMKANRVPKEAPPPGELHAAMIGQPVVTIAPDGKKAFGRWQSLECAASPVEGTWRQYWAHGIYEKCDDDKAVGHCVGFTRDSRRPLVYFDALASVHCFSSR